MIEALRHWTLWAVLGHPVNTHILYIPTCMHTYTHTHTHTHTHSQDWRDLALLEVLLDSHHTVTPSSSSFIMRRRCHRGERTFIMGAPCSIFFTSSSSCTPEREADR